MITPAYSITSTERVLPKMALDFTTASLDSRITFTRSGNTATYTNSNGYIQTVNADIPRFEYNPITLVCRGLLIEESRTNIFVYSNTFSDVSWTKSNCTITSNAIDSPDGTTNASKLIPNTVNTQHRMFLSTRAAAGAYTVSAYMKQGEYTWGIIRTEGINTFFNLASGTLGTVGVGITASITPAANGFYRCVVTKTLSAATISTVGAGSADGVDSFVGNDVKGIYVYGTQMEAGSFATSYIPTVASQVTRTADVAVMTGTNFSNWYNASAGTFTASYEASPNTFTSYVVASNGVTAQNSFHFDNDSGNMRAVYYSGSSAVATLSLGATGTAGTVNNVSSAYSVNNFLASRNAGTVVTDTSGAVPVSLTQLNIGADPSGAAVNVMNSCVRKISFYPLSLTSAEVQAFSK